jgi:hypothetical protein
MGKNGPVPLGCGANPEPYFIFALDSGPATTIGLGFVWPDFLQQRWPPVYVDTP